MSDIIKKQDLERLGVIEALAETADSTEDYLIQLAKAHKLRARLGSLAHDEAQFVESVRINRVRQYEREHVIPRSK